MTRTIESFLRRIASSVTILAAILSADPALANFTVTVGSGTTIFAIDGSNQGTSLCASAECPSHVAINTAGAPIGVSGTPWFVTGSGGTFPATLNATPSLANGNGVVPTQGGSVLSATNGLYSNLLQGNVAISATNGIYTNLLQGNAVIGSGNPLFTQVTAGSATMGKVDLLGNAGAILDFAGQNASSPANSVLIGGQFNTTPTTITSGNSSPLQMDASGNLLVSVKAGGGNPAAGATGFAVPSSGDYIGINIGGTLRGQTGVNPSGSVYAGQTDMTSINGVTTVTAASGVQKVGISGNSGVTLDGSIGAGTAPTNALATLGVYNSTPPTLTTGQSAALQADASGNLKVNIAAEAGTLTVQPGNTANTTPWLMTISQGGTSAPVKAANTVASTDNALEVAVANVLPAGAAVPGSSSPVVQATVSHASVTTLGTSLVAKSSAGNLSAFNCTAITGGSAGYCVAYNGTAAPSTGALTGANVIESCYIDTTAKGCTLSHLPSSIAMSTGIVILVTSAATPLTYTTGTDTAFIEADYF